MTPEQIEELKKLASTLGSDELEVLEKVFGLATKMIERARLEALEEAAKIADGVAETYEWERECSSSPFAAAVEVAEAIRKAAKQ